MHTRAGDVQVMYIPWGIANVMGGKIYLNQALKEKEWDNLREKVMAHELKHGMEDKYTSKDLANDMGHLSLDLDILLFIGQHPSSWVQFSPVWVYDRKLWIDKHLLLTYSVVVAAGVIGWLIF